MENKKDTQPAPFLIQFLIFSSVLFISSFISSLFPKNFPVPTPVIGLVILYLLLTFKIIKVEWVDNLASFLISIIGFLFVPSGISLASSLGIMAESGVQIITVVVISTVIMLVSTTYITMLILSFKKKKSGIENKTQIIKTKKSSSKISLSNGGN